MDRLSGMVDSLLKLTNLEQVPRSDRIKLGELLHQAAEDVSPLAAKRASPFWWKPPLARSPAAESCSAGHCSIWWKMRSNTGRMADRHGSVRS